MYAKLCFRILGSLDYCLPTCYTFCYSYRFTAIPCTHNNNICAMLKTPHLSKHRSSPPSIICPLICSSQTPDRASPEWHTVYHISAKHMEAEHTISPHTSPLEARPTHRFVWQTTVRPRRTEDEQGLPRVRHVQIHFPSRLSLPVSDCSQCCFNLKRDRGVVVLRSIRKERRPESSMRPTLTP